MYENIYVETEVLDQQLTRSILSHYPTADIVHCNRYTEIFNRKLQDFRLQKQRPSLILARKHEGHVLRVPSGYGVGGQQNYYFSVMLNCLYDCRYCFLQGMYRSAHHVVFVNYEDFESAIYSAASVHDDSEEVWFFSGYDCDSLAMEPIIGLADYFIDSVQSMNNVWLELRTKSTQIRALLGRNPVSNVVTAFSMTPDKISSQLENKVPRVDKRITAMVRLQERQWKVGLRFDPLIYVPDYQIQYRGLFEALFSKLDQNLLHSASIGVFRLPKDFYRAMEKLYPDDRFIAQPFTLNNGMVSYPDTIESEMKKWCYDELSRYMDPNKIFYAEMQMSTA